MLSIQVFLQPNYRIVIELQMKLQNIQIKRPFKFNKVIFRNNISRHFQIKNNAKRYATQGYYYTLIKGCEKIRYNSKHS